MFYADARIPLEDLCFCLQTTHPPNNSSGRLYLINHLRSKYYHMLNRRHPISHTIHRFFHQRMFCNWPACGGSPAGHRKTENQTRSKTNRKSLVCQTHMATDVLTTSDSYPKTTCWVYTSPVALMRYLQPLCNITRCQIRCIRAIRALFSALHSSFTILTNLNSSCGMTPSCVNCSPAHR